MTVTYPNYDTNCSCYIINYKIIGTPSLDGELNFKTSSINAINYENKLINFLKL